MYIKIQMLSTFYRNNLTLKARRAKISAECFGKDEPRLPGVPLFPSSFLLKIQVFAVNSKGFGKQSQTPEGCLCTKFNFFPSEGLSRVQVQQHPWTGVWWLWCHPGTSCPAVPNQSSPGLKATLTLIN